ncbi:hypothetical protein V1477_019855 [Vespula maculifrons]|uniref:Uncharacterized protein n=3 Tax=Vespula TaxID=7451 RepID=A0A834UCN7_VESPE|nr:hypothetical protein HZH66_005387 [Vespula vulgaris]KAF7430078.1 hypothetical protein H0235_006476 [Vespula pensylvanica]
MSLTEALLRDLSFSIGSTFDPTINSFTISLLPSAMTSRLFVSISAIEDEERLCKIDLEEDAEPAEEKVKGQFGHEFKDK